MEAPGLNEMEGEDGDVGYTEMQMGQGYPPQDADEDQEGGLEENGDYNQFAFPSFSPSSKKRVRLRKPNFTEECLELLIQLVNEHRDILYTKQAYTSEIHEKKIMVWTHITSQINAISTIPRTMEEVRKKWNDYSYYVKRKRENEKRGIHYTAHTNMNNEEVVDLQDGKAPSTYRRTRNREDRVLAIVDGAMNDPTGGGGPGTDVLGANSDNISSMLLDACQRAREEANYGPGEDENGMGVADDDAGDNSPADFPQEFPKLKTAKTDLNKIPPLPNPIHKYNRQKWARKNEDIRRSSRVSKPVKDVYTPTPKGNNPNMARRRGRPPAGMSSMSGVPHGAPGGSSSGISGYSSSQQPQVMVTGFDEDLVMVNKQRLTIERRRLNVERKRLKLERKRLMIEEQRFKWQKLERKGLYPEEEEEEDEAPETEDEIQETGHENAISNGMMNQLPQTASMMKYETQSPDQMHQRAPSPVVAPALTPGEVSFYPVHHPNNQSH